jgi:hypothetical protein
LLGKHLQKYPPAFFSLFELLPFLRRSEHCRKIKMRLAALCGGKFSTPLAPLVGIFACSALITAEGLYFFHLAAAAKCIARGK